MPKKGFKDALSLKKASKQEVCKNQNTLKNNKLNKDILEVEELKSKKQLCEKLDNAKQMFNRGICDGAKAVTLSFNAAAFGMETGSEGLYGAAMIGLGVAGAYTGVSILGRCGVEIGYQLSNCNEVLNKK